MPRRHVWTVEKLERRLKEDIYHRISIDWGWYVRKLAEAREREKKREARAKANE